jgi:hypothetical protein
MTRKVRNALVALSLITALAACGQKPGVSNQVTAGDGGGGTGTARGATGTGTAGGTGVGGTGAGGTTGGTGAGGTTGGATGDGGSTAAGAAAGPGDRTGITDTEIVIGIHAPPARPRSPRTPSTPARTSTSSSSTRRRVACTAAR